MKEADLHRQFMKEASVLGARLFRNNQGLAWVGKLVSKSPDGTVVLADARPFHGGLAVGSSDLIGWRARLVTEADFGQTIAQFASVEVKTPTGRATAEQIQWIDAVNRFGGVAGIARTTSELHKILLKG
jgi:hypothetical protein